MPTLEPPAPNFAFSGTSLSSRGSQISLSQHYLPAKFAENTGLRKRTGPQVTSNVARGGGVSAFRSGQNRMPGINEDEDGKAHGKARWNKFKWALALANTLLSLYSFTGLIFCILTWLNVWETADVVRAGNRTELVMSTLAASLGVFTSLIGWSGVMLNNRQFLAIYTAMLWVCFAFLVVPGYLSYKRRSFNLEGKVNKEWSQDLGAMGRLRIQNQLGCCGYFSPFVEATVTQTCYARSILPGCKKPYIEFQRIILQRFYTVAFALVPLHIAIMIAGLLCSNHVTYRFGKGMMPPAYRLNVDSINVIMDNYANQLSEEYGTEVASEVLAKSRSNINLPLLPKPGR